MAKSDNQKLKLLYLKKLLEEQSDQDHPMTTQAILDYLAQRGIQAERKSVYSDMAVLQDFGLDVNVIRGPKGGYYLGSRTFELPELKLLVDAVQSSKFLTQRKSMDLIRKLETLASRQDGGQLRRQVVVTGRVKTMNESIYYNVDRIHEAIACNVQIRFQYFDWGPDKQRRYRDKTYQASPYALCWDNENYYLIAHSDRHGITHYRVDKMDHIEQTATARYADEETKKLDLSRYGSQVFGMYQGTPRTVKLRFHNSLSGVVLDRFGRDVMLIPDGEDHFLLTTDIAVSPTFFGWLAGFPGRAKIVYPADVAEEFMELCKLNLAQYSE